MRKINTLVIFLLVFALAVLPLAVLPKADITAVKPGDSSLEDLTESIDGAKSEADYESAGEKEDTDAEAPETVRLYNPDNGRITTPKMYDYIYSVVCAECPMLYHEEAIKAQIVAAYTYTLYCMEVNKGADYDLTTKPETSQAYITREQAFENWGSNAKKYDKRLKKLMNEVWGEYLSYKGEPILAAYHAISSGKTESAKAVWDKNIPYLQSADSEGDRLAEKYETKVEVAIEKAEGGLKPLGFSVSELKKAKRETTDCGTVKTLTYKDKSVTGEQLRATFSLRSANFKIKVTSKKVTFTVYGYGHGLGMSQNGANFMAKMGCGYKEILSHYYKQTKLESKKSE